MNTTVAEDLSDAAHRIFTEVNAAGIQPIRWRMTQEAFDELLLDCEFDGGPFTPALLPVEEQRLYGLPIVIEPMHGEPAIAIVSSES